MKRKKLRRNKKIYRLGPAVAVFSTGLGTIHFLKKMVLPTFKWINSENHNSQGANRGLNDERFKRWSERNVLYFVYISSISFISYELAKIQLRFKEPGISHFYPQYSRMSPKN